jgi:peptidyl-prolyl cis-trans isomerase SurA
MKRIYLLLLLVLLVTSDIYGKLIDEVVAIVGDEVITKYEVESFNPSQIKKIYSIENENEKIPLVKKYYKDVIDFLVQQYTVEIAAKKDGVVVEDSEIDLAIQSILKENNITYDQLLKVLEEQGIPLAQYKWQLKQELLKNKINSRILAPLMVVTEEDIQKYIENNKVSLNLEDRYELRSILVKSEDDYEKVMKYLSKKGSFVEAALNFSQDLKTSKNGGYLGWINKKDMAPDLKKEISNKNVGDVFTVKSDNVYRIFLIEAYQSKGDVDKDVKDKIVDKIRQEKYADVYKKWIERHKKNIFVRYDDNI